MVVIVVTVVVTIVVTTITVVVTFITVIMRHYLLLCDVNVRAVIRRCQISAVALPSSNGTGVPKHHVLLKHAPE